MSEPKVTIPAAQEMYSDLTDEILMAYGAETVCVLVLGGKVGMGFSVSSVERDVHASLPAQLRRLAAKIEAGEAVRETVVRQVPARYRHE